MITFDAHLDLSLNAVEYGRNLRQSAERIRKSEAGMTDLPGRRCGTVSFPEMRRANIALCVATQIAGCMKPAAPVGAHDTPEEAWVATKRQRAWYADMESLGELRQIRDWTQLWAHLADWENAPEKTPIGYLLSLEGADSLRTLDDLDTAYEYGLRALGPAHYGMGRYAPGHDKEGRLPPEGIDLLKKMDELGMILDVTHLSEQAMLQALELYQGPIWASHHNCRTLVDDPRQLTDSQIKLLAQRGAVIGMAFDVWMVVAGWQRGATTHEHKPFANLEAAADHVDHVCQLLGTTLHTGIGSDLDGGFGCEQTPYGMDTIANLNDFRSSLARRGYSPKALDGIFCGNFLGFLKKAWS